VLRRNPEAVVTWLVGAGSVRLSLRIMPTLPEPITRSRQMRRQSQL
jgi:hypothetical protein